MRIMGVFLLVLALLPAAPVMTNIINTAPAPSGVVTVNADIVDTLLGPGPVTAELMYSTNGEASWTTIGMTRIGEPGYDSTFTASFPIPGSGTVYYYLRASDGVSYATQAPVNLNDVWPPPDNLLTKAVDEPAGDTVNAEGPFLDLTGVYMGYSNDYVYAMLTNNSTGWPLYRFPTPWYIYSVALASRQMPTDSFALALAHASIVGIFTTGLALLNRYTQGYQRIADIDEQTSGNRLYLRCLWTSITSRPEFGPWPNRDKFLTVGAATLSFFGPSNWHPRDVTDTAAFYCLGTPSFDIGQNRAPVLSNADVHPRSGLPGTDFRFQVRYTDLDNNPPVLHAVVVDAETLSLIPNGHRYAAGTYFAAQEQVFTPGTHSFQFVFDDGMARATTPVDTFTVFGTAIADAGTSTQESFRAQPNPFRNRVRFRGVARETWLEIRSSAGRLVRRMKAVSPDVLWDGLDDSGCRLPSGVYLARLVENNRSRRLRLIRL
jgi:hypothetical protein